MASLRPSWPDLLDPNFRKIYGDELKLIPQTGPSIFHMLTSTKNLEKDSSASGLSKLVRRSENQSLTYEDEVQGFDVTYTHVEDALGTSVSKRLWEDDQFNVIMRKPKNLANAKIRTQEEMMAHIFNYGFTAGGGGVSTFTSGDALALFASNHTREDGGATQSNYATTDLNEASLETGMLAMRSTLDHKGQLYLSRADTLIVAPALEKEARILLNSTQRVGTANNDINPYQGALKLVVWDWLGSASTGGSDTAWFLIDSSLHQLNFFNRSDRGMEGPDWDFDTSAAKWKVEVVHSVGFSSWRGTYGSKGDNS
jgi:hypothetical protein